MPHIPTNHPVFGQPSNPKVRVWRYMDFAKFAALLHTRSLHFARADHLGDDFEGSLPLASIEARRQFYLEVTKSKPPPTPTAGSNEAAHENVIRQARRWMFVSCWHANEHESTAMWDTYARAGSGIAVQSTYDRLSSCIPSEAMIGEVSYIDFSKDRIPLDNLFWPFVTKRRSYEHEREVRALIAKWPQGNQTLDSPVQDTGISVPVDLAKLIETIHVAPKSPPWIETLARSVVEKYGLTKEVRRSALDAAPLF